MRRISGTLFVSLYESLKVARIEAQSTANLYEWNPSLPHPAVEGGDGNSEVARSVLDRQKRLHAFIGCFR